MYGDSQALSSDAGGPIYPLGSKPKEDLIAKSRELLMDSDTSYSEYKQYNNNQNNSGLLRFRSAPSSFLANFTDGTDKVGNNSAEIHGLTSRFSSSGVHSNQFSHGLKVMEDNKARVNNGYVSNSQLPPQYPRSSASTQLGSVNAGYGVQNPMGMDQQGMAKIGSNLMRQNSSPAGLFSHMTAQNGYARIRGTTGYAFTNGTSGELGPSSNRLKSQIDFSSVGMPLSLGMLSRISEVENETGGINVPNDEKLGNANGDAQFYGSDFPSGSWNNSSKYAENFSGLKREIDTDQGLYPDNQGGEPRNRPPMLSHHLSLPNTSAEITAMEKLLQFQDTVPCKIRAKRGCATHPRSIAERVRRTRISERMRKLQELVPNMDKQTNTADMLDLAVDYIKDLQKQYKILSDIRANCKCSTTQNSISDQMF